MTSASVDRAAVDIAGTEISFETGKLAKQAGGAVVVRAGETMVLCTATAGNPRDVDFLPLTVDVEERMYAAGKIPGSFFKREGRPSEKGILTARMIDRPIRSLPEAPPAAPSRLTSGWRRAPIWAHSSMISRPWARRWGSPRYLGLPGRPWLPPRCRWPFRPPRTMTWTSPSMICSPPLRSHPRRPR
jgi:hypothetical protein